MSYDIVIEGDRRTIALLIGSIDIIIASITFILGLAFGVHLALIAGPILFFDMMFMAYIGYCDEEWDPNDWDAYWRIKELRRLRR